MKNVESHEKLDPWKESNRGNTSKISKSLKNKSGRTKRNKNKQILDYTFNFIPGNTFFYKLHPVNKLLWFVLITYIVLIQNSLIVLAGLFIIVMLTARLNKIKATNIIRKLRWIIIFILFSIVINIFFNSIPEEEVQVLFYIWYPHLPVRRLAVYYAARMALWVLTLSSTGIIFMNTTSPKDIVYGLRNLGFPYKLAFSLMVGLRYVPLIQDNTNTVILAQKARGLDRSNAKTFKRTLEMIKDRLVTSLILIFRNANSTALSMELRAFGRYKERTDLYVIKLKINDLIFLMGMLLFVILLSLYRFGAFPLIPPMPSIYSLLW